MSLPVYATYGIVTACMYQFFVDLRIKHLQWNEEFLQKQIDIHESSREKALHSAQDHAGRKNSVNDLYRPGGAFDKENPLFFWRDNLSPEEAKDKIKQFNGEKHFWERISIFCYFREPDKIFAAFGKAYPQE
jgi:hypothetical protein